MTENMNCPRCGQPANERFYGPCTTCREALRFMFAATKRDVEVADYEPKMNVTPNAVATKE
jgi:NMD protein affecting ribosome stability and mRNA decay